MSELAVRDLSVVYPNGHTALIDVDLHVTSGERVAIVGESGCGKSTLVRAVLGLLPRRAEVRGTVTVDDEPVVGRDRALRQRRGTRLGYVAQNAATSFDPLRSVAHHLHETWRCHGRTIDRSALVDALGALRIERADEMLDRRPSAWSGGMLQRASILAATAHAPGLVLADEPTSALDRPLAREVLDEIVARCTTAIVVSHDLELLDGVVDRVVVMYAGRVVEDGAIGEVLVTPRHPYTRALLLAVPSVDRRPVELPGDPPRPDRSAVGCAFVERCAVAEDRCRAEVPAWRDGVRCHLSEGRR